jgi:cytochrome P450
MDGRTAYADAKGRAARVHSRADRGAVRPDPRVRARARAGLPDGEVDAFAHFTDPLPIYVMAELLGVDASERAMFKRCGD